MHDNNVTVVLGVVVGFAKYKEWLGRSIQLSDLEASQHIIIIIFCPVYFWLDIFLAPFTALSQQTKFPSGATESIPISRPLDTKSYLQLLSFNKSQVAITKAELFKSYLNPLTHSITEGIKMISTPWLPISHMSSK